jgi:hypothetical protein
MSGAVQFHQLMQEFHDLIGLPHEPVEDGVYRFDIDGQQEVMIGYSAQDDRLILQGDLRIGLPASQAAALLQANAVGASDGAVFTAVTANGTVALVRHVDMAGLNVERFEGLLEDLVMRGDVWRERLAAAGAEAAPTPGPGGVPAFSTLHLRA